MKAKNERTDDRSSVTTRGALRSLTFPHAAVALLVVLASLCVAVTLLALVAAPLAAE